MLMTNRNPITIKPTPIRVASQRGVENSPILKSTIRSITACKRPQMRNAMASGIKKLCPATSAVNTTPKAMI